MAPRTVSSSVPSRDAAMKALRRLARAGAPLYTNLEAPLRRAVLLYWGGMAAARKALKLRAPAAPRQKWSCDRVIADIRKLHRSGQHMSTSAVIGAGRGDLVIAARKYAGSWVQARALAGVSFQAERAFSMPVWDATTVVAEIQVRLRQEESLAFSKSPQSLTCAARRIFGSWRSAIEAAGIDYDSILLLKRYDDEALLDWLRKLARSRPHMTLYDLDKLGEHTVACRRRWGSLERAAQTAGLTDWPTRVRRRAMSRSQVLRMLRGLSKSGHPTELSTVRNISGGHYLINSAFHHFTTWRDALTAAGLRP